MMHILETFVPFALLAMSVILLAVALFTWRAGGKYQVMTSSILVSVATAHVLPDGSGIQLAIRILAASLVALAFMITPRARLKRMRVELTLIAAAIALIWILALFELPYAVTIAGLVLLGVLVPAAFLVMLVRANNEDQKRP